MSINNFSNFNMPSLNGLVDINADNVSSTTIESENVDTQTLIVNGLDLGYQVNQNAQKLTAISYTSTPSSTTIISSNAEIDGIIQLREPSDPNKKMDIYYETSANGFRFFNRQLYGYMYFSVYGANTSQVRNVQFSYSQYYSNMPMYCDAHMNVSFNNFLNLGDSNFTTTTIGSSFKYVPNSDVASGLVIYNKGLNNNTAYYTNILHNDLTNTPLATMRMNYANIWSKVPHTCEQGLSVVGDISGTTLHVSGYGVISGTLAVNNTAILDSLSVYNASNFNGNVNMISTSNHVGNATFTGNIIANSNTHCNTLDVSNNAIFNGNIIGNLNTHCNTLDVSGNTILNGSLTTYGNTNFYNDVYLQVSSKLFAYGTGITQQELSYLSGVSSAIQTQLNNKLNLSGGSVTGNITMTGNFIVSSVTITPIEFSYLDTVSSNIQTQIDSKLNLSGGTLTGALSFNSSTTSQNKITQSSISGDNTGQPNQFKYSTITYNSTTLGTANPCLTISDTFNNNSFLFLPNSGSGSYNPLSSVNSQSLIARGTGQDSASLVLSTWSTLRNGMKASATSSTNAQTELWAGNLSSITLNNSTGISINSDNLSLTNTSTTATTNYKSLSHTFVKADGTDGTSLVVRGNLSLPVASTGITFSDSSVQMTAFTSAKNTILTNLGSTMNANLTPTATLTSAGFYNAGSISLQPGTWIITVNCGVSVVTGSTTVGQLLSAYSTSSTALSQNINLAIINAGTITYTVGCQWVLATSNIVTPTVTTTYYLLVQCSFGSPGRFQFNGGLSALTAVRII